MDDDELREPNWYIQHCQSKLGKDFITNARGLLTDEIRADLERLRDFQFSQHPSLTVAQTRLDALSAIVRERISMICAASCKERSK